MPSTLLFAPDSLLLLLSSSKVAVALIRGVSASFESRIAPLTAHACNYFNHISFFVFLLLKERYVQGQVRSSAAKGPRSQLSQEERAGGLMVTQ